MPSSVILHNIQHPQVENDTQHRSIDAQVNGFGFYRTVLSGTVPKLVHRVKLPERPIASLTSPIADMPFFVEDALAEDNDLLLPQMTFLKQDHHSEWLYTINSYAYVTPADRAAILADVNPGTPFMVPLIEGIGHLVAHKGADADDTYCMHAWEIDLLNGNTETEASITKGTFRWEGMHANQAPTSLTINTTPFRADSTSVRFWTAERINNSQYELIFKTARTVPVVAVYNNAGVSLEVREDVYCTQVWELEIGVELEEDLTSVSVCSNSEDSQGRHATHRWEIDLFDIVQTFYWTFQDSTDDDQLGEDVEDDNDVPPPGNLLAVFQEHMFLAGDPDNPHYLAWSKRFRPESWPVDNFVEIGTPNDPITKLAPITGVLGVFTRATKYRVSGNATSGFVHDEAVSHRGTSSPRSVTPTDRGVLFVARDGVYSTNFLGPDSKLSDAIDPIFLGETKNGYSPINWDAVDQIAGGFYKNRYYFSYPSGTATVNDMTAVYSFDTEHWTFWDVGFGSFYREHDTDLFLAGGTDSLVYVVDDPGSTDDDGAEIGFELHTRNFFGGARTTRNLFLYFKVDAECQDGSVDAAFYVDDVAIATRAITGSRTCLLQSLPENTFGKRWRVSLSYTGNRRVSVFGVSTVFLPLLTA